ncbi:hypothetical protein D770_24870 [Flammeovirgaceae bacterium 311]|nr:hypothetical protein D770_24870 [Flammeovirgaceae bacterium 311]
MKNYAATNDNHLVVCFGWMAMKTAIRAIEYGTPVSRFKVVVEEDNDLQSYLPKDVVMSDVLAYKVVSRNHLENWETNKASLQALAAGIKAERLILITDLDSQECTFALTKFIGELDQSILDDALLIFITPFWEESLNWKRALPYLNLVKQLPLRKQIINLPYLMKTHKLEKLILLKVEKYYCAYINNVIEEELNS